MVCRLIILQDTYLRIIMDYNLMLTLSGEETLQVILSLCILFSFLSIVCPQMNILYIGVYYSNIFIVIFTFVVYSASNLLVLFNDHILRKGLRCTFPVVSSAFIQTKTSSHSTVEKKSIYSLCRRVQ